MRVELYLDLMKDDPIWNNKMVECREGFGLMATNSPVGKMDMYDRIKVTVQLPDRYFKHKFDESANVVDVEVYDDECK